MSANAECPLCRLQRKTDELLKDRRAEDLAHARRRRWS